MVNYKSYNKHLPKELKSGISISPSKDWINNRHHKLNNKIETGKDNNSYNDIDNIFLDFSNFSFFMCSIGNHKQSIINQQNNCQRKAYIYHPLQIGINIIFNPSQCICYFIGTYIRSFFIIDIIQCCLLNFIWISTICITDYLIQNSNRIATVINSSSRLSQTQKRKRKTKSKYNEYDFFHGENKEINIHKYIQIPFFFKF